MTVPILAVDDNAGFLTVLRAVLMDSEPRFQIFAVDTGAKAIAFLERRSPFQEAPKPAFLVLDFRLPDMNAPKVLEAISTRSDLASIPVLVLSQAGLEEDERAARDAGASEFCVKPSCLRALERSVLTFWKERVRWVAQSC